jgi:ABC-type branched-subunit amino acid transport system ATPase component
MLLADQSTALALRVTETAHLLECGRLRASGATHELVNDDAVRDAYLGAVA